MTLRVSSRTLLSKEGRIEKKLLFFGKRHYYIPCLSFNYENIRERLQHLKKMSLSDDRSRLVFVQYIYR